MLIFAKGETRLAEQVTVGDFFGHEEMMEDPVIKRWAQVIAEIDSEVLYIYKDDFFAALRNHCIDMELLWTRYAYFNLRAIAEDMESQRIYHSKKAKMLL